MYLSGDAKLWWRIGSSNDATVGRPKIRTWETLKKELKDQFLPKNTMWMARESVTPQNPRVPLITPQRIEYLWVSHASIPPYRIPFTGIHSCIYILEKYTNLSKQFIRVRVTTLLYTKYYMQNLVFLQKCFSKSQFGFLHTYSPG